ncbi:hypothetical protein V492_01067 [Pseudogymnoascus sp. VKM F-4246]|nr:hypothetical protein V492_01067 [Pseudogymnoascus sp. VKM F-4246]
MGIEDLGDRSSTTEAQSSSPMDQDQGQGQPPSAPPSRPQAFRRPHHKSRLGCVQCKQRKIKASKNPVTNKPYAHPPIFIFRAPWSSGVTCSCFLMSSLIHCDENKPSCDKCTRYNTPCSFVGLQPSKPALEVQANSSPKLAQRPKVTNGTSHTTPYPSPSVSQGPSNLSLLAGAPEAFTLMDLELLHHYTISTCFTISDLRCWQTAVPSIAVSYPFLMHCILATAARHLAYLRPTQPDAYIAASDKHHHLGLSGYREALTEITQENCHACAAYTLMLNVYAWTSFHGSGSFFLPDLDSDSAPNKVELITILRGGNAVMSVARQWVLVGPLSAIYVPWVNWEKDPNISRLPSVQSLLSRTDDSPILPHEDDARLERLAALWAAPSSDLPSPPASHGGAPSGPAPLTPEARQVLFEVLFHLRRIFVISVADNGIEAQAATLSWSIIVSDAYIGAVQQRSPPALVLLAHYCILLKRSGERWWIEGKAEELLGKIKRILEANGEGWMQWIEWPMREVGVARVKGSVSSQSSTVAGTPV